MINQKMYWKFRQEHNLPHDEAQRLASLPKFAGGGKVKAVKAAVKAISHPPELMAHFKRGKKLQNDPSEWARDELAENFEPDSAVLRKKYGEKAYMAAQDASYPEGYAGGGKVKATIDSVKAAKKTFDIRQQLHRTAKRHFGTNTEALKSFMDEADRAVNKGHTTYDGYFDYFDPTAD